jgi:poly-beta-hydroxyalkanoate depolymerase
MEFRESIEIETGNDGKVSVYVSDNVGHHASVTLNDSKFLEMVAPVLQKIIEKYSLHPKTL